MRNAETVLGIIQERGKRGLPLEDIYRQLFNPDLYLRAYARLYSNKGAMSKGMTSETVDGMSLKKIETIIDALRQERYRWTPVRRVYIPKKNGKQRPLGVPTWSDKLLQEVIRLILEAYYEPQMSDHSHGFRPDRGCQTALTDIKHTWTGTTWFIEGDIAGCFDNMDHAILLSILKEHLHDARFIRLLEGLLKAGYLEAWKYHTTLSGTPQGGVVSPILANIYLHQLDHFVETVLLPTYNRKAQRTRNAAYRKIEWRIRGLQRQGKRKEITALKRQRRNLPARDPDDADYRRLRYVRYADDFLLGFAGPKAEAEEIRDRLKQFLRETLKLELSQEKTLITHARSSAARFLGYEIATCHANDQLTATKWSRNVNGRIELRVPVKVIEEHCVRYMAHGKPTHRKELAHQSDFAIVEQYQWQYRGLVQYYALAVNIAWLNKLRWVMRTSLLKTLALKHKSTVSAMVQQYQTTTETPYGSMTCLEVKLDRGAEKKPLIARFGGIPLRRQEQAILSDSHPFPVVIPHNEVVKRLLRNTCELCGSKENISVHHVRALKDLQKKGRRERPAWMQVMAAMRRKTLVVCAKCHWAIHAGTLTPPLQGH